MDIVQATILGLVQGVTEFLPISSSGHLVLFPKIFGWEYQGLIFDVILHLGTLFAVVVYFRKKIWLLLNSLRRKCWPNVCEDTETHQYRGIFLAIILSVVPAGVIGLWLGDIIEANTRSVYVVAVSLIFWGVMLGMADYVSRKIKDKKTLGKINWKNALFIGFAQVVALIPGTSRSGITMTAGLFAKFNKKDAAEFSFLMSIPIIAAAGFMKLLDLYSTGSGNFGVEIYVVGFLSSMLSGFVAIWILMKVIERWSFMPFVVYRIMLGVFILLIM
ncbi:MAG: undecaprenyl-diphosphate phosphatase [bacterium]|nr:undecaprenyl-diphosphate phosphatase [bacterium]